MLIVGGGSTCCISNSLSQVLSESWKPQLCNNESVKPGGLAATEEAVQV